LQKFKVLFQAYDVTTSATEIEKFVALKSFTILAKLFISWLHVKSFATNARLLTRGYV